MGDVIPIEPSKKKTDDALESNRRKLGWRFQRTLGAQASLETGQVIPVNFDNSDKQLQLLRFKTRELDQRRLTLYSGATEVNLPGTGEEKGVTVRIMVKNSKVDYYFFCPDCGRKILGSVNCKGYSGRSNCLGVPWKDVQEMVRNHILKRAREAKDSPCRQSTDR